MNAKETFSRKFRYHETFYGREDSAIYQIPFNCLPKYPSPLKQNQIPFPLSKRSGFSQSGFSQKNHSLYIGKFFKFSAKPTKFYKKTEAG